MWLTLADALRAASGAATPVSSEASSVVSDLASRGNRPENIDKEGVSGGKPVM